MNWHSTMADPTVADAILDRLVANGREAAGVGLDPGQGGGAGVVIGHEVLPPSTTSVWPVM
jgi:hypothetical protein